MSESAAAATTAADGNQWWEVVVDCPSEMEDTVFWAFTQLGAQGTASQKKRDRTLVSAYLLTTQYQPDDFEMLKSQLNQLGIEQVKSTEGETVSVRYGIIAEEDWAQSWKDYWQPEPVGERLLINPAWMEPPKSDRTILTLDPGSAFGTGTHPTTQLCLKALEQQPLAGKTLADIGCGSGILSIAALKFGARQVYAADVDPLATKATRSNADLNQIDAAKLQISQGSVAEAIQLAGGPVDGLVCNILSEIIVALILPQLSELAGPHTWGILSGILTSKADWVEEHLNARGWTVTGRTFQGEWCAMTIARTPEDG